MESGVRQYPRLDLLFVLAEGSGSIDYNMQFGKWGSQILLSRLLKPPDKRPIGDMHFGVTSSRCYLEKPLACSTAGSSEDGKLLVPSKVNNPPPASWPSDWPWPPNWPYLTSAHGEKTDLVDLAETYVEVASYDRECDVPQFLKAATRAIDGRNAGFVRDDSLLAIVLIADREDCSTKNDGLWVSEWWKGQYTVSAACYEPLPDLLYPPEQYVDMLKNAHLGGGLLVAVIGHAGVPQLAPLEPEIILHVKRSCSNSMLSVYPTVRLEQFLTSVDKEKDEHTGGVMLDACPALQSIDEQTLLFRRVADEILAQVSR